MQWPWLPAEWGQDQRLAYPARGVLAELVATAPGEEMSVERLVTVGAWGDAEAVEEHLVALERAGYLVREGECWYLCDPFPLT
jgi:hypothetical protein